MFKFFLALSLFCFFLFFACKGSSGQTPPSEKLTVILDWYPNINHAPILITQQLGLFDKYHLKVAIITPADPTDPPKWVAMKKADIALDYQPHVLMEIARGLPLKQVGTLIPKPLNCLVVLANSPIKKVQDLKGKKIAYSSPEIDLIMLKTILASASLALSDVEPINVHYDLAQALLTGRVNAAIGMMRNVEPIQLALLGQPVRAFLPESNGFPIYSELVFVAEQQHADDPRFNRFFAALNEGRRYLVAHPQEGWQLLLASRKELNTAMNKGAWKEAATLFPQDFQAINAAQYNTLWALLNKTSSDSR